MLFVVYAWDQQLYHTKDALNYISLSGFGFRVFFFFLMPHHDRNDSPLFAKVVRNFVVVVSVIQDIYEIIQVLHLNALTSYLGTVTLFTSVRHMVRGCVNVVS